MPARYRVGVDTGGTFTDFVALDLDSGGLSSTKVPSSAGSPGASLLLGLERLGIDPASVELIAHGTTVGTNAVIEKKGAMTALVTTAGFRDLLEIRRGSRGDMFDLQWDMPKPLISRANRLEITERLLWDGSEHTPVRLEELPEIAATLAERGAEAVAVVLLHAYVDGHHEQLVRDELERLLPGVFVCISSEVSPEIREFERTSTTVVNAYLGPLLAAYMSELERELEASGFMGETVVMQSSGGLMSTSQAKEIPARTIESGPAGGAMAAAEVASRLGEDNAIALDIGGTSADVSLVRDGRPRMTGELSPEFGCPVVFPAVDVVSIGAGGGSIAWIDAGGALRVGPASAGADPGPACYGHGVEPTTTDAQVVLGRIDPKYFAGGTVTIDPDRAYRAIAEKIAEPLGLPVVDAASAIVEIMTNNTREAIRLVTVRRGYDPRDFVLVGMGGGGPLYAADLARQFETKAAIIPPSPGVASALGLLQVDFQHDASRTILKRRSEVDVREFDRTFIELESGLRRLLERESVPVERIVVERHCDVRYEGQVHSLSVAVPAVDGEPLPMTADVFDSMVQQFHKEHLREYGHEDPDYDIEVVHLRVFARGRVQHAESPSGERPSEPGTAAASSRSASVYFHELGGHVDTMTYDRSELGIGSRLEGPAIVNQMDTTVVIPPGMTAAVDRFHNLTVSVHAGT